MKTWTLQNFYLSYILAIICKYTQNTLVRMCHVTANCMLLMNMLSSMLTEFQGSMAKENILASLFA